MEKVERVKQLSLQMQVVPYWVMTNMDGVKKVSLTLRMDVMQK